MDAAASVAPMSVPSSQSQSSRKEWRVVSDHHEDLDRVKLGQGDERLIYEVHQRSEPITVSGGFEQELRLDDVVKQREQLQDLEVHIKARLIARSEVMGMQERFDSQIKEHIASNVKLEERLHEREKAIMDLQRTVDDKDKELHVIKLEHEAAWAKEDLLREQNMELATFRRERDNSEAERAQHLNKIHELQEHVQEKERQFLELQEQHRVAQEAILYKDEQIREAQAWIARAQEMDALQSTTNHSLQAELRERTEQYNQLWIGCQRQFSEMERLHLHTLHQLEIELSEARERSGNNSTRANQTNARETSHLVHGTGSQLEASVGTNPDGDSRSLQNGDAVPSQTEDTPTVQMASKSLHGMPTYFPSGQLHPFIFHHPQNVNSHLVQSHVGQFHSVAASSSIPHWQNQQALSEVLQMQNHEQHPSQKDLSLLRPETNYDYEASVNGQTLGSDFLNVVPSSTNETEQQSLQQITSQLHGSLRLNHSDNDSAHQEHNVKFVSNHKVEAQNSGTEQRGSAAIASQGIQAVKISDVTPNKVDSVIGNSFSVGKTAENLFDEETLLACVVRTIPPGSGGRIQISSTLLSRLTKMLAPLRWSDYENKHGKLDAFLRGHPELFVIEGDYIQVQEGAQEIIAGMVARAKIRAATVAASHPSLLSSVAVTPMAQTRLKQGPSVNSFFSESHHSNGVSFNPVGVRVLSKHNDQVKQILVNGNGTNLDRPNLGSQGKVINSGRPGSNYHGKQQGRSTGGLLGSRK
ncbi:hypothetical protein HanPI659440_Chr15g0605871 [Helianthus annuus]|uniref:DUF7725 domain-containing protein n=1 Tax=Helianthus annuus TaxID=4232 RepID=A0A9K3E3P8_HELAN|nr:uncharacterized protein LOC110912094 isoform X1 [Helianthus annuus]KAF5765722.1 hypothetical protein HanXRQr2_Chr15g0707021 [Helianthus annuus]KAJ0452203.1 hypothetical protein HanHA300_Chr15g0576251 [Helianthus annuus]KAJ0457015.1 hypothetical protein HanIR_Chr15g0769011 [Helianthus annuus]KAJ0649672.1 hypothetical protein HanLR1_Chr15g0586951 [Helianthus annuus]KAJ0653461.1 hypothetical protein HanOQP8_Chr15g0583811 [Helianthus annuus]